MSKMTHIDKTKPNEEHGTTGAYIMGFVLSIIFTLIPYYLVVNEVISGGTLLAAILGIAVWQMIIQLVFFLHLGRGPKPLYNIVFFFATAGVILITIGASLFIMHNLYQNMSPDEIILRQSQEENIAQVSGKDTGACTELRDNHVITISKGVATPGTVEASRCDTLSFVNEDDQEYTLRFGVPPESVSYGGLYEVLVETGNSEPITLNQTGNFYYYGSEDQGLSGYFSVAE